MVKMMIKIKNNKKHAFTMAEVLISLMIIGFLFAITVINMSGISANNNTTRFKKAYSLLEGNILHLINNSAIYGTSVGFRDTESINVENTGEILGFDPYSKFRDCIKYRLNVVKDEIKCNLYGGSGGKFTSVSGCFQTDDGIVWGIPDTDFVKKQVISIKDSDNDSITALPVTVYVDYKENQTVKDNAVVFAVTYDGKIYILKNIENVNCNDKSQEIQCKVDKYITATTIKVDDRGN